MKQAGAQPTHAARYRAWGIALALLGVIAFSVRPILIKLAYAYVTDPVTLIALRMVFSLPFFVAMALWARRDAKRAPIARRDVWAILLLGFLGYYLASFLDFLGLQYISAGVGRLMLFLYPTITVMLSALFLGKRPNAREVVALVISYAGLALVLSRAFGGENKDLLLGALLVFGSAVSYAIYLVTSSQVVTRVGSVRFTAYATSVASLLCLLQFLLLRPWSALALPLPVYGLAIGMAVGCTVLPVLVTSEALRRIGANQVAIVGAAGPVTTIFLGWLGLEESMTLTQIAGAFLVLAGVMLVTISPKHRS